MRFSRVLVFSLFRVADSSTGADVKAEGNDECDEHDPGSGLRGAVELLFDGLEASGLGGTSSDVSVPPPHGRFAETLALKIFLDGLEELLDLFLNLSSGLTFSLSSGFGCFLLSLGSLILLVNGNGVLGNAVLFLLLGGFREFRHALVEVLNFSSEFVTISSFVGFPGSVFGLELFGVGAQGGGRDVGTGAFLSAHNHVGCDTDGTVDFLDDGAESLVDLLFTRVHARVLKVSPFLCDLLLHLIRSGEESVNGFGSLVISSGGKAEFVNGFLRYGVDHEDGDGSDKH